MLERFARLADADLARIIDWGPDGITLKPNNIIAEGDRAAIVELSMRVGKNGGTRVRIRLQDKQRALDSLARHFQLYSRNAAPVVETQTGNTVDARKVLREKLLKLARAQIVTETAAAETPVPETPAPEMQTPETPTSEKLKE